MSLTEIMSNADLSVYPQVAMTIFLGVFVLVCIRALRTNGDEARKLAHLALEDEAAPRRDEEEAR